jgi:hypothetical protein
MKLGKILEKKKPAVLKKWLGEIFDTYPADTSRFLKGERDMFANPVGHTITANAERILAGLIKGDDPQSLSVHLEQIMRIRAVQDFTPSGAVSFIAHLKKVITGQLETELNKYSLWAEWAEFETRIDILTQRAYELHMEMKNRIAIIRTREIDKNERFARRLTESRK